MFYWEVAVARLSSVAVFQLLFGYVGGGVLFFGCVCVFASEHINSHSVTPESKAVTEVT